VDFTPAQPTAYDGAYLRVLSDDYDIWKVDIPLTGAGAPDERIEEIFEQVDPGSVDLLLVLDDGSSMSDKIEELADVASTLVTSFEAAGVDYHIAVVSSDMTDVARSGRFLGEVLSADHDDPASALKAQIDLAAGGPGNHGHFDAVMAALDEPLVSGPNAGFLREDSRLTVLAYADSDDRTGTATPFSTWLNSLTADPELSQFASVSGPTSGFLPCFSIWSGDSVEPAPALGNAVGATGGYHQDICEVDAAGIVDQVAVEAAGLTRDFPLSNEVTQPDWIEVTVDGLDVAQSSGNGFTYVDALNAVRFHGSAVPLPGAEVVVAYPSPVPCD
jgi:hypothetical protein